MSIEVIVDKSVNEIMEIVHELRGQGYVQGVDFDFSYSPHKWDGFTLTSTRFTKFTFYKEKYATLFALKYGR